MRAILLSVKPEWVAKILNGEKTIEIRKTMPKCEFPIDVYIYCTNDKNKYLYWDWYDPPFVTHEWFVSNNPRYFIWEHKKHKNGKVVAKFTLNKAEEIICRPIGGEWESYTKTLGYSEISQASCLRNREIVHYLKGNNGYAWYISDLEILDKPKELSDFGLKKAPQSWRYVEN